MRVIIKEQKEEVKYFEDLDFGNDYIVAYSSITRGVYIVDGDGSFHRGAGCFWTADEAEREFKRRRLEVYVFDNQLEFTEKLAELSTRALEKLKGQA